LNKLPFVTIIIPCLNEADYIAKCLDSMIGNDYPHDRINILVVDGMSMDGSRDIVKEYAIKYPFITLLDNHKKIIPAAMNIGIKNSESEIVMKVDSHAAYPSDYISKCIKYLVDYKADNVGGTIIALPRNNSLIGRAITLVLSSPAGVGNSLFRIGGFEKPLWADTAFSGCYRRTIFNSIGLYDENIVRSEDVDLNSRMANAGYRTLLVPEIKIYYYARSSFIQFCKHNYDNGKWVTYPLRFRKIVFSLRHITPLVFLLSLLISSILFLLYNSSSLFLTLCILYGVYILVASTRMAIKERSFRLFLITPLIFFTLHVTYGLGSLWGIVKVFYHSMVSQKNLERVSNA